VRRESTSAKQDRQGSGETGFFELPFPPGQDVKGAVSQPFPIQIGIRAQDPGQSFNQTLVQVVLHRGIEQNFSGIWQSTCSKPGNRPRRAFAEDPQVNPLNNGSAATWVELAFSRPVFHLRLCGHREGGRKKFGGAVQS
jgi:hypothetical protein